MMTDADLRALVQRCMAASHDERLSTGMLYREAASAIESLLARAETAEAECARLRDALNAIASWREGETVTGAFDEPASAQMAREALAEGKHEA